MEKQDVSNKPAKKYRAGSTTATVWANKRQTEYGDKIVHSVTITRNYKDGEDWKTTNVFYMHDLNDLMLVGNKAFEWIRLKEE